ncbi:MAG: hypothetical protein QXI11_00140 [Thermoproteota archaeon]
MLIEAGIIVLSFILKLEIQALSSLQLLICTFMLTRDRDREDDLWNIQDLRPVEKVSEYPGNLENSVLKSFPETDCKKSYHEIFGRAIRDNINGFPIEKAIVRYSKSSDRTIKILMRLVSSLFSKDAVSAKKALKNYILILRENDVLKNERRNILSEARFRARIMLIISALLMGFLSAAGPVISTFFSFSLNPVFQIETSLFFSLFTYLISVSILVHYSLSYRNLWKTLSYSVVSFVTSFLIFNGILTKFLLKPSS